jgi:hypothetical protein
VPQGVVSLVDEADTRAVVPPGHPYDFGAIGGLTRLLLTHPRIGPALGPWPPPPGLLLPHAVARRVPPGRAQRRGARGRDQERRWCDLEAVSSGQGALCELAEKLSGNPTRMVERDWQPLRDLGFDDIARLEVVAHAAGLFNHRGPASRHRLTAMPTTASP